MTTINEYQNGKIYLIKFKDNDKLIKKSNQQNLYQYLIMLLIKVLQLEFILLGVNVKNKLMDLQIQYIKNLIMKKMLSHFIT